MRHTTIVLTLFACALGGVVASGCAGESEPATNLNPQPLPPGQSPDDKEKESRQTDEGVNPPPNDGGIRVVRLVRQRHHGLARRGRRPNPVANV